MTLENQSIAAASGAINQVDFAEGSSGATAAVAGAGVVTSTGDGAMSFAPAVASVTPGEADQVGDASAGKEPSGIRKNLTLIKNIVTWVLVVIVVAVMLFTIFGTSTLTSTGQTFLGHNAFIVQTDSMSATDFGAGDVIVTKPVDPTTLKEGDIITFTSRDSASYGETVTHKIREVTTDSAGNPGFITYGTTTDTNDESIVTYSQVIGQYQFSLPQAGNFFVFLKTIPGYFICIFTPFFILIALQAYNTFKLYKQYKREVEEENAAEQAKVAQSADVAEENARLQAELAALRAQMGGSQNAATDSGMA